MKNIRSEFPIFKNHPNLIYLDNANTTQKPSIVLDAIMRYYTKECANIHRAMYELSEHATESFETARHQVASFLGVLDPSDVVFTSGTTHALNLIARGVASAFLKPGDEILIPVSEHHANIVSWQIAAKDHPFKIRFIPINTKGELDLNQIHATSKTKVIVFSHMSNVLGSVAPIKELVQIAQNIGAITVVDGAQAAAHIPLNLLELGIDFYAFSGHKICGPTGIGAFWAKKEHLTKLPPLFGGGAMIERVQQSGFTTASIPYKFEAGTQPIAEAIGLGAACEFMTKTFKLGAVKHVEKLGRMLFEGLKQFPKVKLLTPDLSAQNGVITFTHDLIHPHDLSAIFGAESICVRGGHHCAQPLMDFLGIPASLRISPFIYNTEDEIEAVFKALTKAEKLFSE